MFRIRHIHDQALPVNRAALEQVERILRAQFPYEDETEATTLGRRLENPFWQGFRSILFVAEDSRHKVLGFALVHHDPDHRICLLDYLATTKALRRGGVGGALYERVRYEAAALGAKGIFLECLPDDPRLCRDPANLGQNRARLRFYERYGARPIVGTRFETPVKPGDPAVAYLVYDSLDHKGPLRRAFARKVVRTILRRKYWYLCPPDYVAAVVASFRDDPVRLRDLRYLKPDALAEQVRPAPAEPIALVVTDCHAIHHIRERGYVEAPVRIPAILARLEPTGDFERVPPQAFAESHIKAVHDANFVDYLRRACKEVPDGTSVYPYVFPIRNRAWPPRELSVRAGYYCIDTFTPLTRTAYAAARRAVDCALTATQEVLDGRRIAYALVRPPGHHAERQWFGGFCYFNNAAIAANRLSAHGTVAILDLDFHHGNGQQDIFYERPDVLTVSIHCHPRFAYPHFTGFARERGAGPGEGRNLNLPLPEQVDGPRYRQALAKALGAIRRFTPQFLVIALGLDTAKHDPTGSWALTGRDFRANGEMVGELDLPTLVVQEGGYRTRTLGLNTRSFFDGLRVGVTRALRSRPAFHPPSRPTPPRPRGQA